MRRFLVRRPVPILWAATAFCVALLAGCSRENDDWRATQSADTTAAYQQFVRQYPGSAHAADANTRLAQLAEDEAWQMASSQDSLQAYQQFVSRFPEGKWAQEARVRIENFSIVSPGADTPASVMAGMAGGPAVAPGAPASPPAVAPATPGTRAGAQTPPATPPAVPPPQKAPASAGAPKPKAGNKAASAPAAGESSAVSLGVQLGAFSTAEKANAAWQKASGQWKTAFGKAKPHIVAGKSGGKGVYRLQVSQADEAHARALCAQLKAKGQACVVLHP